MKLQVLPFVARQELVALDGDISTEPQPAAPSTETRENGPLTSAAAAAAAGQRGS